MLADTTIVTALDQGDLSVGYSFIPNAEGVWIHQEPFISARDHPDGRSLFENLFVKSRVALTMGPLVKPLDQSNRVPRTLRFEGHDGVVDLRRAGAGYHLPPGEAALVLTNEQIDLSHRLGALVLGRVSSNSDGLVVSASYLDPTWSGLIRLHVHNTSHRPAVLRLGNEIGRMFLFDTSDSTPDPLAVAHQGLHYGYSWKRIFDDGIDPFPERAPLDHRDSWSKRLSRLNALAKRHAGATLVGLVALMVVPALRAYQQIDNWSERFDQLDELSATVDELSDDRAVSGIETITWADGADTAVAEITLPDGFRYAPDQVFSTATIDPASRPTAAVTLEARVARSGDRTTLTIRAIRTARPIGSEADGAGDGEGDPPLPAGSIDVRWLVVP